MDPKPWRQASDHITDVVGCETCGYRATMSAAGGSYFVEHHKCEGRWENGRLHRREATDPFECEMTDEEAAEALAHMREQKAEAIENDDGGDDPRWWNAGDAVVQWALDDPAYRTGREIYGR